MNTQTQRFIPALHLSRLTPLYDPLLRWGMREDSLKRHLVDQLALRPGMTVLDLGCGTGTLVLMIRAAYPGLHIIGLDVDPSFLAIARQKAARAGLAPRFDLGLATSLPYPPGYFDRVVSSLVFHHLTMSDKRLALAEARRVLRPGGQLHILDFGPPYNLYTRFASTIMRHFEETAEQFDGRLPTLLLQAGFTGIHTSRRFTTIFGSLTALQATNS